MMRLAHEREAISERTKVALAAAKARGKKLGGPRLAAARRASIEVRRRLAEAFAANVRPIIKDDRGERRHQSARHRTRTNSSRRQDRSRR
jgi:DNA invertase Pin-like site-specific DNA recombinase